MQKPHTSAAPPHPATRHGDAAPGPRGTTLRTWPVVRVGLVRAVNRAVLPWERPTPPRTPPYPVSRERGMTPDGAGKRQRASVRDFLRGIEPSAPVTPRVTPS